MNRLSLPRSSAYGSSKWKGTISNGAMPANTGIAGWIDLENPGSTFSSQCSLSSLLEVLGRPNADRMPCTDRTRACGSVSSEDAGMSEILVMPRLASVVNFLSLNLGRSKM